MDLTIIGKNIRKYRKAQKLTQEQLAEMVSISTNYVGMIECGKKIPSLETFLCFANALFVSADQLLEDTDYAGYKVKDSLLSEKLDKLPPIEREKIYAVIDTMVKHIK